MYNWVEIVGLISSISSLVLLGIQFLNTSKVCTDDLSINQKINSLMKDNEVLIKSIHDIQNELILLKHPHP